RSRGGRRRCPAGRSAQRGRADAGAARGDRLASAAPKNECRWPRAGAPLQLAAVGSTGARGLRPGARGGADITRSGRAAVGPAQQRRGQKGGVMCGICGFNWADERLIERMKARLVQRGPDDHGSYVAEGVSLSHRRLSIVDLSDAGRQPLSNEDGTVWITFNGEIYNHLELRSKLEARGHLFRSRATTEVIVHAYEEYGLDFARHLTGMFALALSDAPRRRLILA